MSMLDQETLTDLLGDKEYAHEYMDEFLNTAIATQIKVLREQRLWTQEDLAEAAALHQEQICLLENVNNSSWTIKTLLKLARAYDVRLHVSFETFRAELIYLENFNFESIVEKKWLQRVPREEDLSALLETQSMVIEPGTGQLIASGGAPEANIFLEAAAQGTATVTAGGIYDAVKDAVKFFPTQPKLGNSRIEIFAKAANQLAKVA